MVQKKLQKSIFVDFRLSKPPKTKRTSIQYYNAYLNDFKDDQGDGDGFIKAAVKPLL